MKMESFSKVLLACVALTAVFVAPVAQAQEGASATARVQITVEGYATVTPRSFTLPAGAEGEAVVEVAYATNRASAQALYVRAEGADSLQVAPSAPVGGGQGAPPETTSSVGQASAVMLRGGAERALITGIVAAAADATLTLRAYGSRQGAPVRLYFELR